MLIFLLSSPIGSSASVVSLNDLRQLASTPGAEVLDQDLKLDYGPFEGSDRLRSRIAELHSSAENPLTAENVIITPGSIMANYLVLGTICEPGDHVICQYPVYSQLHLLPKHNGVDVSLWAMKEDADWLPDINQLVALIKPNTKAIILNNPNNPIGAVLPDKFLKQVIQIAEISNIIVFCDEVFSPLFHTDDDKPSPMVSLGYKNSISSGSLSKSYGIPGVRVGWVVSPNAQLLRKVLTMRDYTTIAVSRLDDAVAAFALDVDVLPNLMKRNLAHCKEGIQLIDHFVNSNDQCRWTKPKGGGTAFVQILDREGRPVDDAAFCAILALEEGLCLVPGGWCFRDDETDDFKGYCRFPLGDPDVLRKGLPILGRFLAKDAQ
ncbi:Capreomycidine synthase-like protein [Cladobotryum mycophilum]|uniref:Capreomycidine synthase-like protein n=1 Tax=Cladobotryum mycophilum TaxID=491253 RepID=A0ABR0SSW6_9HYPO